MLFTASLGCAVLQYPFLQKKFEVLNSSLFWHNADPLRTSFRLFHRIYGQCSPRDVPPAGYPACPFDLFGRWQHGLLTAAVPQGPLCALGFRPRSLFAHYRIHIVSDSGSIAPLFPLELCLEVSILNRNFGALTSLISSSLKFDFSGYNSYFFSFTILQINFIAIIAPLCSWRLTFSAHRPMLLRSGLSICS